MKTLLVCAGVLVSAAGLASAQSRTIYSNSFEAREIGPEWSSNTQLNWDEPTRFSTFNGRYSNGSTTLTLNQPAGAPSPNGSGIIGPGGHTWYQYIVRFDLYIIDSWDGSNTSYGQDWFNLRLNTSTLLRETFSNQEGCPQTFREPDAGRGMIGFDERWRDSKYFQIERRFTLAPGEQMRLTWADSGLQGMNDESWGIDNVWVGYDVVPAPGAAAALLPVLGMSLRRRRN